MSAETDSSLSKQVVELVDGLGWQRFGMLVSTIFRDEADTIVVYAVIKAARVRFRDEQIYFAMRFHKP
jgi:hypothetical protein